MNLFIKLISSSALLLIETVASKSKGGIVLSKGGIVLSAYSCSNCIALMVFKFKSNVEEG